MLSMSKLLLKVTILLSTNWYFFSWVLGLLFQGAQSLFGFNFLLFGLQWSISKCGYTLRNEERHYASLRGSCWSQAILLPLVPFLWETFLLSNYVSDNWSSRCQSRAVLLLRMESESLIVTRYISYDKTVSFFLFTQIHSQRPWLCTHICFLVKDVLQWLSTACAA